MRQAILVALAFLSACSGRGDRPDVILIVMDTVRGDHCSLNGYERPTTPFLESLAQEGTLYTDAWAPTCWTGPSHASLFTGLRPEHHGFLLGVRFYLDESANTLAELLSGSGYETGLFTCNPSVSPELGLAQGFGEFELFPESPGQTVSPSRLANARALEFVRLSRSRSRPYLLVVNHFRPHLPYDPPEQFARRFLPADAKAEEVAAARAFHLGDKEMLGGGLRDLTPRQRVILTALYDAEIAALDEDLWLFVDALRNEGALDDAVLVITSDHGENLGDHGLWGHFMDLHRSVRHVPLLIRHPPSVAAGARIDSVVRLEDVYPTLLALCGEQVPKALDGRSLLSSATIRESRAIQGGGANDVLRTEYPGFYESGAWRPRRAFYDGRYHLIRRQDGVEVLYDVRADPSEERNLIDERPELADELRRSLPDAPWGE